MLFRWAICLSCMNSLGCSCHDYHRHCPQVPKVPKIGIDLQVGVRFGWGLDIQAHHGHPTSNQIDQERTVKFTPCRTWQNSNSTSGWVRGIHHRLHRPPVFEQSSRSRSTKVQDLLLVPSVHRSNLSPSLVDMCGCAQQRTIGLRCDHLSSIRKPFTAST